MAALVQKALVERVEREEGGLRVGSERGEDLLDIASLRRKDGVQRGVVKFSLEHAHEVREPHVEEQLVRGAAGMGKLAQEAIARELTPDRVASEPLGLRDRR